MIFLRSRFAAIQPTRKPRLQQALDLYLAKQFIRLKFFFIEVIVIRSDVGKLVSEEKKTKQNKKLNSTLGDINNENST